jgi:membrane fusion protein (multidrug efflux system)
MTSPFLRSELLLESQTFHRNALGLLITAGLLGLWLMWFFKAQIAVYAVSTTADLEVDRAAHPVGAQYAGRVVASTLVLDREVQSGEVLIELDSGVQESQLREARTRLTVLQPQIKSLEGQIEAEKKASAQEQQTAAAALEEAGAHLREANAAAQLAESGAARIQRMYNEGLISKMDLERVQADAQERRAAADSLGFAMSRLERQQVTAQHDRQARQQGLLSEQNRLEGLEQTVGEEINRLEDDVKRHLVRAPVGGKLGEIADVHVGSVVHEGEKLAAVVPTGKLHIVANFNPADAAGRIRPGQFARLRLEGFPWTQFGSVPATVASVASEIRDGRIRVELAVNPGYAPHIPLQHGLPGTVEVQVERTSPASLVLRNVGRALARPTTAASTGNESQP